MDYRDADMPLSSFGGENSSRELNYLGRDEEGRDSPTFEMGIDEGRSMDGGDSVAFDNTPVLRESIASPAFEAGDYDKENRLKTLAQMTIGQPRSLPVIIRSSSRQLLIQSV